ncbi:hypothetical protein CYMTET_2878 [Cymbomonas tetramitiformis]|uniref:Uncharacterized protein n=1 Tax=Cymbomonas tetramitiformis TaxID=36881 RepID=A0AAE0H4B7_9CHLO|nr:hypothetical protein CYMTET_2878 [Cymbomonas tetramitiformis]
MADEWCNEVADDSKNRHQYFKMDDEDEDAVNRCKTFLDEENHKGLAQKKDVHELIDADETWKFEFDEKT